MNPEPKLSPGIFWIELAGILTFGVAVALALILG